MERTAARQTKLQQQAARLPRTRQRMGVDTPFVFVELRKMAESGGARRPGARSLWSLVHVAHVGSLRLS
eukprot:9302347-Lingulodinium_polyedra.AAC.1